MKIELVDSSPPKMEKQPVGLVKADDFLPFHAARFRTCSEVGFGNYLRFFVLVPPNF